MVEPELNSTLIVLQKKVSLGLLAIACLLILGHIAGLVSGFGFGHFRLFGLVRLFDLNEEGNVPTYFSSMLHFIAGLLLFLIAFSYKKQGDRQWTKWFILGLFFFYVSIDESASIHELAINPVREYFGARGLLYFAWVIPACAILIAMGVYFARFLFQLPSKTRLLFFLSGGLFLGGAIGVELPEGLWVEQHGRENLVFGLFTAVEESLEMFGVILFIHALTGYLAEYLPRHSIVFQSAEECKAKKEQGGGKNVRRDVC